MTGLAGVVLLGVVLLVLHAGLVGVGGVEAVDIDTGVSESRKQKLWRCSIFPRGGSHRCRNMGSHCRRGKGVAFGDLEASQSAAVTAPPLSQQISQEQTLFLHIYPVQLLIKGAWYTSLMTFEWFVFTMFRMCMCKPSSYSSVLHSGTSLSVFTIGEYQ